MKVVYLFSFVILLFSGCKKRLDPFLFANDNTLESYKFDDYTGETSLIVGSEYNVDPSKIHEIRFTVLDEENKNIEIAATYVGDINSIATDTVIVYCHGNAKHNDFYWPRQKLYAHIGGAYRYGVLMVDYAGYGVSEGLATEKNMYASVKGALKWLKNNGLSSDRLVIFGFSLGSAPACEIAAHASDYPLAPSKVILEAPFASSETLIQDAAGLSLPASYFVNLKIDNAEEIKKVKVPLLWIHGEADSFLTVQSHGQVVFNNYTGPKKVSVLVPNGEHETTPFVYGYENYLKTLTDFILN